MKVVVPPVVDASTNQTAVVELVRVPVKVTSPKSAIVRVSSDQVVRSSARPGSSPSLRMVCDESGPTVSTRSFGAALVKF